MLDLAFAAMSNSNDWCGYHRKVLSSESPQPKGKVPWLVVSTPLKNISQWEGLSNILWKIKNVWNHQPARIHLAVSEQDAYPQITILVGKWWLSIGLWLALFSDKTKPAVFFFFRSYSNMGWISLNTSPGWISYDLILWMGQQNPINHQYWIENL